MMPGQAGHDGKRPGMTGKDVIPDIIGDLIALQAQERRVDDYKEEQAALRQNI